MKIIAHIETDFPTKFGIPRQSGLVKSLKGKISFESAYRNPDALKGLEGFSHLWLLWGFSEIPDDTCFRATARPPKLGGNRRIGIFATRSPYHPNRIGLSNVSLDKIEINQKEGPILYVSGADMVSGSPIYDIKPYLPYTDCHIEAKGGFTDTYDTIKLPVVLPEAIKGILPPEKEALLLNILAEDPRPSYQSKEEGRSYGFPFAGHEIKFTVEEGVLTITAIE